MKIYILCFINILVINFMANAGSNQYPVEMYPSSVSDNCRNGVAKVYDECSDQHTILKKALRSAKNSGKSVLLVYGSEWCIWCHVFDKYIKGQSKIFDYKWEYENEMQEWKMQESDNSKAEVEAKQLNRYVSRNFVIAHIEGSYSPNGLSVVASTGFEKNKVKFLPFILVLNSKGKYAGHMLPYNAISGLEIRKDGGKEYRGFDRKILLRELKKLRVLSLGKKL